MPPSRSMVVGYTLRRLPRQVLRQKQIPPAGFLSRRDSLTVLTQRLATLFCPRPVADKTTPPTRPITAMTAPMMIIGVLLNGKPRPATSAPMMQTIVRNQAAWVWPWLLGGATSGNVTPSGFKIFSMLCAFFGDNVLPFKKFRIGIYL